MHPYTHAYIRTYIHTYVHTYIHKYIHACIHTRVRACVRNTYTHIHTCVRACMNTYIHTYTHTHTPIEIKAEETAKLYRIIRNRQNHQLDHEVELKDWTHPADSVTISEQNEANERTIQIFTDGSKNEHRVGSETGLYIQSTLTHQMKRKLHDKCSNNQAEQMAIVTALQAIETIKINNNITRTIKIHTDSRITLESLKNMKN